MEWGTVSAASMAGMVFSLIIVFGLPIALIIIVHKKTHAKITACLIGGGVFIAFAMILEQILHRIVFGAAGTLLQENIVLYAVYGGLAAALFEETGRYAAMRFVMKKNLSRGDALIYGIGHGGTEAVLTVGFTYINNLVISIMINTGTIRLTMLQLDGTMQKTVYEQLRALWELAPWQFYVAGVERIAAVMIHICCSLLVFGFVRTGMKRYFLAAFLTHFLVDSLTVLLASVAPVWVVELLLLAAAAVLLWAVWKQVYVKNGEENHEGK